MEEQCLKITGKTSPLLRLCFSPSLFHSYLIFIVSGTWTRSTVDLSHGLLLPRPQSQWHVSEIPTLNGNR